MAAFPLVRHRRLRQSSPLRDLVSETVLSVNDLIYPFFVAEGISEPVPIRSMPGLFQYPLHALRQEAKTIDALGIPAALLFGIPANKDSVGSQAYAKDGIVQRAIDEIKTSVPRLLVITDVCLCEYTDHGHCGVLDARQNVVNDSSLELLSRMALSHAQAGADVVAPSDMMDGRVGAIRSILDRNGFFNTPILSYAAKYASAFYGPFREAAQSAPQFGDRKSYQMDHRNVREALREIAADIDEGADMVMIKPALSYLDVITKARARFDVPICAYSVSGEYAMIRAGGMNGWIDEERIMLEVIHSIKRAGADMIITYFAPQLATWLRRQQL